MNHVTDLLEKSKLVSLPFYTPLPPIVSKEIFLDF